MNAKIEAVEGWDGQPAFRVQIGRRLFSVVTIIAPSAAAGQVIRLGEVARLHKNGHISVIQRFANIADALHWTLIHGDTSAAKGDRV